MGSSSLVAELVADIENILDSSEATGIFNDFFPEKGTVEYSEAGSVESDVMNSRDIKRLKPEKPSDRVASDYKVGNIPISILETKKGVFASLPSGVQIYLGRTREEVEEGLIYLPDTLRELKTKSRTQKNADEVDEDHLDQYCSKGGRYLSARLFTQK
jgi:hypothetical protein